MQIAPQAFHDMSQNTVMPLAWSFRAAFDKEYNDDVSFFMLNNSVLNGNDVLSPAEDNPLQQWDKYHYQNLDDKVISMEWSREIEFPYSVQSSIADVSLNNYNDYFTPNSTSPLAEHILPKRPIRIYSGFKTVGTLPQFVGLTQGMPEIDDRSKTADFHALDFLSEIYALPLDKTVAMHNVRTDEVLREILLQFGLLESQFNLARGRNTIPFVFFERGLNAGNVLRDLMQAEMGKLWLDEQGIIRFDSRLQASEDSVMTFDEHNIINLQSTGDDEIINTVKITSDIRMVQNYQPIYSNAMEGDMQVLEQTDPFIVPAGSTAFYPDAILSDPALTATPPTIGRKKDNSWFTAVRSNGSRVHSGVSVTFTELRTNSYVMLFSNTNPFPVTINQVEVWGRPAKVVDTIRYQAHDEESVEKYGHKVLGGDDGITNHFIATYSNCDSFAEMVIDSYKEYAGVIEMRVKGNPALQLADVIYVDYQTYSNNYKIIGISYQLRDSNLECVVRARRYTPRDWFILNQSVLNGSDLLAP